MKLEMTYIHFENQFWLMRQQHFISSTQADVYQYLLKVCNQFGWPKSFMVSNVEICAALGMNEKTVIDARKRLAEIGLIKFDPGITKKKKPTYYLQQYLLKASNPVGNNGSINGGYQAVLEGGLNGTYIKRREENKKEEIDVRNIHTPFFLKEEKEECANGLLQYIESECPQLQKHKNKITLNDAFALLDFFPGKKGFAALKAVLFKMNAEGIKPNSSVYGKLRVWMRNEIEKGFDDEVKGKILEARTLRDAITGYIKNPEFKSAVDQYMQENSCAPPLSLIKRAQNESELHKKLKAV